MLTTSSVTYVLNGNAFRSKTYATKTELLDEFSEAKDSDQALAIMAPGNIGFRDATFAWSAAAEGAVAPFRRQFHLHIENEVVFKRGQINLVVGPTGSGKTSLLMALLGEMHFIPSAPGACFSLPREGGVAFAAQESWVLNETIRVRSLSFFIRINRSLHLGYALRTIFCSARLTMLRGTRKVCCLF